MSKIKNMLLKYFGRITLLTAIYNEDIFLVVLLLITLSVLMKSNNTLNKLYKKFKKNNIIDEDFKQCEDRKKNEDLVKSKEDIVINLNDDASTIKKSINLNAKKNNDIKNNIKLIYKKKDEEDKKLKETPVKKNTFIEPYTNDKPNLQKKYDEDIVDHNFVVNVNSTVCSTPIFNLRTYKDLDFHYNFLIHDFCPKKINNLIMCKDIHQWMTTSSLSSEDLSDELVPIYFVKKQNDITDVFEYLKLFIHTDKNNIKIAFIQKGVDFLYIKDDVDQLISKDLIKDLLLDKHYYNYNLSVHDGVSDFLKNFLSLVLIPEHCIGEQINLDIKNYYENQKTFEFFFNTVNSDVGVFNTTI